MAHPNIEFSTNTIVDEVLGVDEKEVKGAEAARREDRHDRGSACQTVCFSASGTSRTRRCLQGQIDLDDEGYVLTQDNVLTTRKGDAGAGRVCMRRRAGPAVSAGDYGCGHGLHGGA